MSNFIDFRSDTVTKPTDVMRRAMADACVGDDVFSEDPTVIRLESRMAALFGKEAGLFFPTGTMSNLAAIMTWCDGRGEEIIVGSSSHILLYEGGGAASIGGVALRSLPNEPDGTIRLESIIDAIRTVDIHYPVTRMVALENTHNYCGGRVLPVGYVASVAEALRGSGIALHMDGARIWNAAIATGVDMSEAVRGTDSVSICMSKGIGAPVGSVLVGPADFIAKARRVRKALGGGMRQAGVLAAACLVGLDDFSAGLMQTDHARAKRLASAIDALPLFRVNLDEVETNLFVVYLVQCGTCTSADVCNLLKERGILVVCRNPTSLRIATHRDLTDDDIDAAIRIFKDVSDIVVV